MLPRHAYRLAVIYCSPQPNHRILRKNAQNQSYDPGSMFFGIYGVGIVDFGEAIIKIGLNPGGQLHNVRPFSHCQCVTLQQSATLRCLKRGINVT